MTNLVNAYTAYVSKRASVRARQRQELEQELKPALKAFGAAILEAQQSGKRIEDIEYLIGTKNRTLIYRAKRLAKGIDIPDEPTPQEDPEKPSEQRWKVFPPVWNDFLDIANVQVIIDGTYVTNVVIHEDGSLHLPDAWAADTENQVMYREIIAHIKTQV